MILMRTHAVDHALAAVANDLERWSGLPVVFVADERKGSVETHGRTRISLTAPACEEIGLYCPRDFAWRCGDYGFYLARAQYPAIDRFWLFENDVRLAGRAPEALFGRFAAAREAMIASYVEPVTPGWAWADTVLSRDATPIKCFFPVVQLSAAAIDALLARRQAQARRWARRRLWPNDEGFVATTLAAARLPIGDLNDAGPAYRPDQFYFEPPIDGDLPLESDAEVALFHPVLTDAALARKRARLAARQRHGGALARIGDRLARRIGPDALARAICRRQAW